MAVACDADTADPPDGVGGDKNPAGEGGQSPTGGGGRRSDSATGGKTTGGGPRQTGGTGGSPKTTYDCDAFHGWGGDDWGSAGWGGNAPDGAAGYGGSVGSCGSSLYSGSGIFVALEDNSIGIQGAFYILEDSVDGDANITGTESPPLPHTDLVPSHGGSDVDGVSKFDQNTTKLCVSGFVPQVTDETGETPPICSPSIAQTEAGACQWDAIWGGGIGLLLNATEDDPPIKGSWDATTADAGEPVTGFVFALSGDVGAAEIRFYARVQGSDDNFCYVLPPTKKPIGPTPVPVAVRLTDLVYQCWNPDGKKKLDLTQLESVHWLIVSSHQASYEVTDFCIESLSWY